MSTSPAILKTMQDLEALLKLTPAALAAALNRGELSPEDLRAADVAAEQIRRYGAKLRHLVYEYRLAVAKQEERR